MTVVKVPERNKRVTSLIALPVMGVCIYAMGTLVAEGGSGGFRFGVLAGVSVGLTVILTGIGLIVRLRAGSPVGVLGLLASIAVASVVMEILGWPRFAAGLAGSLVAFTVLGVLIWWRHRARLRRLGRAAAKPEPLPARELRWLGRADPSYVLQGAAVLEAFGRFAEVEAVIVALPPATDPRTHAARTMMLVTARVELDDLAGARAAIAELASQAPTAECASIPALLEQHVRIYADEAGAAAVAAELTAATAATAAAPPPAGVFAKSVARRRWLVHAEAAAAAGDRILAERLLRDIGTVRLRAVAHSNRPIAAVATAMLSGAASTPFR